MWLRAYGLQLSAFRNYRSGISVSCLQPRFLDTPDKGLMQHFVGKALLYPGRHPHLFETGFRLKRHLISMPLDRWVTMLFAVLREVTRSGNRLPVVRKPPAKNVVSEIRFFDRQNGYRSWEPRLGGMSSTPNIALSLLSTPAGAHFLKGSPC
jgi:hypothetical protein